MEKRRNVLPLAEEPKTFEAAIDGFLQQGCSKAEAVRAAVHQYPELHEAYVRRYNERRAER